VLLVVDLLDLWVEREIISGSTASTKAVSGSRDDFWLNLVLNEKNGFISRFHGLLHLQTVCQRRVDSRLASKVRKRSQELSLEHVVSKTVPHLLQAVSVNIQTNITQPCVTDVCNHIY
jgi:hypothetical protein